MKNTEEWRKIPGYDGFYEASTEGRIRSMDREVMQNGRWGASLRKAAGMILKPLELNTGYMQVTLGKQGVTKKYSVHRLILLTFIGPSDLPTNHKDGVKANNQLTNLEYCTYAENTAHSHQVLGNSRGERSGKSAKLNDEKVRAIRADTRTLKVIAAEYGVTYQAIHHIKSRKNWAHVE
jgi:hypothetical protein